MKNTVFNFMISILAVTGYSFQQNQEKLAFKLDDSH